MDAEEQSKKLSRKNRRPPARTPQARENQMVNLAVDLAEQQMRDGTASAQVITHYLKLGSSREQLEQERLRADSALKIKKVESMAAVERLEELYTEAMKSMTQYAGNSPPEPDEDDDGYD